MSGSYDTLATQCRSGDQSVDNRRRQGPVDLIIDSTGLKVCGQGAWHAKKHGETYRKRGKKLHIGVDAQGQIIASTVTDGQTQDPSHVLALLAQVERDLHRFIGDGIYDQEPVYVAVEGHSPGPRGYYAQAHAENAFSRYKRTFGGHMRAKEDAAQEREAAIACAVRNRMREPGRLQSYQVS